MNKILLALVVFSLLVGCASLEDPPPGFAKLGDYCLGEFAPDRNQGPVKLNVPEPDYFNPHANEPFESIYCPQGRVKRCEWRCDFNW